jgi:hypothetical protein
MDNAFVLQVVTVIATAGAMYGAIRGDIKALHEKATRAQKTGDEAHRRLDAHLEKH